SAAAGSNGGKAINIKAAMTGSDPSSALTLKAGTDININAGAAFNVATLTATAGNSGSGNVNIKGAQSWTSAGAWTFAGTTVNVNARVTWWAGTLTLKASNNIDVYAVMTASGTASLVATYGSGTNADGTPMGLYTGLTNAGTYAGRIDFSGT